MIYLIFIIKLIVIEIVLIQLSDVCNTPHTVYVELFLIRIMIEMIMFIKFNSVNH